MQSATPRQRSVMSEFCTVSEFCHAELLDVLIERDGRLTQQSSRLNIRVDQLPDHRYVTGTRRPDRVCHSAIHDSRWAPKRPASQPRKVKVPPTRLATSPDSNIVHRCAQTERSGRALCWGGGGRVESG